MTSERKWTIAWSALGIALLAAYFFFVAPEWSERSSTTVQLVESYSKAPRVFGVDLACAREIGAQGSVNATYPRWAAEPPIFHYFAVVIKKFLFTNIYVKLAPFLLYLLTLWGLLRLIGSVSAESLASTAATARTWVLLLTIPALALGSTLPLPDWMMLVALTWSLAFLVSGRWEAFISFAWLAVTAKALAAFALIPIGTVWLLKDSQVSIGARLRRAFVLAGAVLPTVIWLLYLRNIGIHEHSPYFQEIVALFRRSTVAAMEGEPEVNSVWRFVMWMVLRGTGLIFFGFAIAEITRAIRDFSRQSQVVQILSVWALCAPMYWIFVGSSPFASPWYSLPFVVPFAVLGIKGLAELKSKPGYYLLLCLSLLWVLASMPFTTDLKKANVFEAAGFSVPLRCGAGP